VAKENKDPQNIGLFKETLSVLFGLNKKTIDRVMAIISNSEDKLNIKTYIIRDKAGPRAAEWLRKSIAYARKEGSAKHETDDDYFDLSKDQDLESTARAREQQEFDELPSEEIDMDKPIKECTFRDYLLEFESSAETSQEMHRDVEMASKRPDAYGREQMKKNVNAKRDIQQSDGDPDKAQKLRIIDKRLQAQKEEELLKKKTEQAGARPMTGMSS